jgi:hypothetical protein
MQKDIRAVTLVSIYLLGYCILLQFGQTRIYAYLMLGFAPILLIWMVYVVLKKGKYNGPELGKNEFGYVDKQKDEPDAS